MGLLWAFALKKWVAFVWRDDKSCELSYSGDFSRIPGRSDVALVRGQLIDLIAPY